MPMQLMRYHWYWKVQLQYGGRTIMYYMGKSQRNKNEFWATQSGIPLRLHKPRPYYGRMSKEKEYWGTQNGCSWQKKKCGRKSHMLRLRNTRCRTFKMSEMHVESSTINSARLRILLYLFAGKIKQITGSRGMAHIYTGARMSVASVSLYKHLEKKNSNSKNSKTLV